MTTNKDERREGYLLQSHWRHVGWVRWKRERKEQLRGRILPPLSSSLQCFLNSFCSAQFPALLWTFSFTSSFFCSTNHCHYARIVNFDLIQQNSTEVSSQENWTEKMAKKCTMEFVKRIKKNSRIKLSRSKCYHREE